MWKARWLAGRAKLILRMQNTEYASAFHQATFARQYLFAKPIGDILHKNRLVVAAQDFPRFVNVANDSIHVFDAVIDNVYAIFDDCLAHIEKLFVIIFMVGFCSFKNATRQCVNADAFFQYGLYGFVFSHGELPRAQLLSCTSLEPGQFSFRVPLTARHESRRKKKTSHSCPLGGCENCPGETRREVSVYTLPLHSVVSDETSHISQGDRFAASNCKISG